MAARVARLVAAELATVRAEVEAAEAANVARVTTAELEALRDSSVDISISGMAAPMTSSGWQGRQRKSRRHKGQPRIPMGRATVAQIGADARTTLQARTRTTPAQTGTNAPRCSRWWQSGR
jgi:hypothetical protein